MYLRQCAEGNKLRAADGDIGIHQLCAGVDTAELAVGHQTGFRSARRLVHLPHYADAGGSDVLLEF